VSSLYGLSKVDGEWKTREEAKFEGHRNDPKMGRM
jgi:hypothetical protein